jgi:hypothetical protein
MSTSGSASTIPGGVSAGASILIRGAKQVVTLQGPARIRVGKELTEPAVLRDASILIQGGRIAQIGSTRRLENMRDSASARWVDARHMVVLPGAANMAGNLSGHPNGTTQTPPAPSRVLSRTLTRELTQLALAGVTFSQFSLRYPEAPTARSHLLRHILRVDLPAASFLAALEVDPLHVLAETPGRQSVHNMIPPASRHDLGELKQVLALQFTCEELRQTSPEIRFQVLRKCTRDFRCQISDAARLSVTELLTLGVASPYVAVGRLPRNDADFNRIARWSLPWIMPAGSDAFVADPSIRRIALAVSVGVCLALATGFQPGQPGVANPLVMMALLRMQTGLSASELLHLVIANCAFALGVGTIEKGKEANLLLVECEDYRDIGLYVGQPRIASVFRRGVEVTGAALRGEEE